MLRIAEVLTLSVLFAGLAPCQRVTGLNEDFPFLVCLVLSPESPVLVEWPAYVNDYSGYHNHADYNRPPGSVSPTEGLTDNDGCAAASFRPERWVAGVHYVISVWYGGSAYSPDIQVKLYESYLQGLPSSAYYQEADLH